MPTCESTNSEDPRRPRPSPVPEWVQQGLRYVPSVARRYLGLGLDLDELIAAGNLGLVEAALRFDPLRKVKFVTYADWWIRKSIMESFEVLRGPVRFPRNRHEKLGWVKKADARWRARFGEAPTVEQLSSVTGLPVVQIERLIRLEPVTVSLDHPRRRGIDDRPLVDSLEEMQSVSPQQILVRRDLAEHLRRHMAALEPRQRQVIDLRFGFDGQPPRTLREVARVLELSRERVRQIELGALLKIRRRF